MIERLTYLNAPTCPMVPSLVPSGILVTAFNLPISAVNRMRPLDEMQVVTVGDRQRGSENPAIARIELMMQAMEQGVNNTTKPVLTTAEAAAMISVSTKRFTNILYEEKARLGRFPDFVCDAGGILQRRIIRDELIAWLKQTRRSCKRKGTR